MDDGGIVSPIQKMAFRASRLPFLVEGKQFPHADDYQSIQKVDRLVPIHKYTPPTWSAVKVTKDIILK